MRAEERAQQAEASISMRELLCSPTLRAPLLIGVVMQLSQQLSGINAVSNMIIIHIKVVARPSKTRQKNRQDFLYFFQVFYYSTSLFTSSGLTEESAKFATMGIGAIMVGMTLVSLPLMDRTGRRTLHLYGLGGMFIFSIFITISFLIKVCLIIICDVLRGNFPLYEVLISKNVLFVFYSFFLLNNTYNFYQNIFVYSCIKLVL